MSSDAMIDEVPPSPQELSRQTSEEYPEWYTSQPDPDVWGDDDAGWDDDGEADASWGDATEVGFDPSPTKPVMVPQKSYRIMNLPEASEKRNTLIEKWADLMSIPEADADALLRFLRYNEKDMEKLLTDAKFNDHTRRESGIADNRDKKIPHDDDKVMCGAYCAEEPFRVGDMHALSCGHYLCNDCWQGMLESEATEVRNAIFCTCPCLDEEGNKCMQPVDLATWKKYIDDDSYTRVVNWVVSNYVDCATQLQWCPNAGCGRVITTEEAQVDIHCKCDHIFCSSCQQGAHQPCPCDLAKKWNSAADDDETATQNWLESMTKPCPKCGIPIEKNRQCNHIRCSHCNHNWCWQCRGPFGSIDSKHPSWYKCATTEANLKKNKVSDEDKKRRDHQELISTMLRSRPRVEDCQRDRREAESLLPKVERAEEKNHANYMWLTSLVKQIIESERFLEWSFVVLYFASTSGRKEHLEGVMKMLEEVADGTMHDLSKALHTPEILSRFLDDIGKVNEIKKAEAKMQSLINNLNDQMGIILPEITNNDPDPSYPFWHCTRCTLKNEKKSTRKTCTGCNACRLHSDFDCLVSTCKN